MKATMTLACKRCAGTASLTVAVPDGVPANKVLTVSAPCGGCGQPIDASALVADILQVAPARPKSSYEIWREKIDGTCRVKTLNGNVYPDAAKANDAFAKLKKRKAAKFGRDNRFNERNVHAFHCLACGLYHIGQDKKAEGAA